MLQICLFGRLRVFYRQKELPLKLLPKSRVLLAWLLLNRDEAIGRQALAFLLWPDSAETTLRPTLRRHLHNLKTALPPAATPWLLLQNNTVQWNPSCPFQLDIANFATAAQTPDTRAQAVQLYTDDLLPELYDDLLHEPRERLRQQFLTILAALVQTHHEAGDLQSAHEYATRLLQRDPFHEPTVRALMQIHVAQHNRPAALAIYQQLATDLAREIGTEPMPETVALHRKIAGDRVVNHLPALHNRFFGRIQTQTNTIQHLTDRTKLVTLTGTGGTGKTRLALEIAHRLTTQQPTRFADGIHFIDCTAATDTETVFSTIANVLEIERDTQTPLVIDVIDALQSAEMLLLLDNLEQAIDSASAIGQLLARTQSLRLLVTSRIALNLYGEQLVPLDPLPLPAANCDLASARAAAAVALFVERARAFRPNFALTQHNLTATVALCRRLEGLPLALELAATRVRTLSVPAIVAQLEAGTPLHTAAHNRPARHRTLTDTIAWSYHLLPSPAQRLFDDLAVFRGGFSAEAVAAVCEISPQNALDQLTILSDHSMIHPVFDDTEPRFDMLATLREFALAQLHHSNRLPAVARRHADHFAAVAHRANAGCKLAHTPNGCSISSVKNTICTAPSPFYRSRLTPKTVTPRLHLLQILSELHHARSRFTDSLRLQKQLRDLAHQHNLTVAEADAWQRIGFTWQRLGNLQKAHVAAAKATRLTRHLDPATHYLAQYTEAWMLYELGRHPEARALAEQSITNGLAHKDTLHHGRVLNLIGCIEREVGEVENSAETLTHALAIYTDLDLPIGITAVTKNLAETALHAGDLPRATTLLDTAHTTARHLNHTDLLIHIQLTQAELTLAQNRPTTATHLLTALLNIPNLPRLLLPRIHANLDKAHATLAKNRPELQHKKR